MYRASAHRCNRVHSSKDHPKEVAVIGGPITGRRPKAGTLLDVACDTGNHLPNRRSRLDSEGPDGSVGLVKVAGDANLDLLTVEPWFPADTWHADAARVLSIGEPDLKTVRMSTSETECTLSVMGLHCLVSTAVATYRSFVVHPMVLSTRQEMIASFPSAALEAEYPDEGNTGRVRSVADRVS